MNTGPQDPAAVHPSPGSEEALQTVLDRPGDCLLVTFGGVNQGMGLPPFEFRRMTAGLDCKLALVRDPSQAWYQGPLPGVGEGLSDLALSLERVAGRAGVSRVACIGNSMGGYAALAVGSLMGADRVAALAPQSFIGRGLRLRYLDRRWSSQMRAARRAPSSDRSSWDLSRFLAEPGYGAAEVYAGRDSRLDRVHAERLRSLPRTRVHLRAGRHDLVKRLRDEGELQDLLQRLVSGA